MSQESRLRVAFGGSLQVTAPPLEQTPLPHGVAVTSSQPQKAQLPPPVVLQVSHVAGGQTYHETLHTSSSSQVGWLLLLLLLGRLEMKARKRRDRARESPEVNSGSGLGGRRFSTRGVSTCE